MLLQRIENMFSMYNAKNLPILRLSFVKLNEICFVMRSYLSKCSNDRTR